MHFVDLVSAFFLENYSKTKRIDTDDEDATPESGNESDSAEHAHALLVLSSRSTMVTALLLEFGISIHSVLIGIALGTARDEFVPLLIALCFHQFFEGIGLGHILAEAATKKTQLMAGLSGLFYSMTTPTGVAIGIVVGSTSAASTPSIIAQGVLDSIASGILIYSALVSLVSVVFKTKDFKKQVWYQKLICFISFYAGAGMMSTLAIWA